MEKVKDHTKVKIVEAAIKLFNVQGYNGTSVRMIAEEANVNVALISYYFGGKQGLLEHLMVTFFEGYLKVMEQEIIEREGKSARLVLMHLLEGILHYQQENHHLARFVHREITLDTTLVRELMCTYLMKEKHYYYQLLKRGMENQEFKRQPIDFIIIQIRGMVTLPYLHPQYIKEVHHLLPHEKYFIKHYYQYITIWMDSYLCQPMLPIINKAL